MKTSTKNSKIISINKRSFKTQDLHKSLSSYPGFKKLVDKKEALKSIGMLKYNKKRNTISITSILKIYIQIFIKIIIHKNNSKNTKIHKISTSLKPIP